MGSSVPVVELSELCVWCGGEVRWVGDPGCWVHSAGGLWCRGSILRVATPTEWTDGGIGT